MDVYYVDHRSLLFDARILLKSVSTVLSRERRLPGAGHHDGAVRPHVRHRQRGHAPMTECPATDDATTPRAISERDGGGSR